MHRAVPHHKATYALRPDGEFIIKEFNFARPFANFFPGIAGKYGIPMWVFYVNRGQAIASFGIKDKDHAILEFFPANRSWQLTSILGFRTFIKFLTDKKIAFYEPFHNGFASMGYDLTNQMAIRPYELLLNERNRTLGLEVNVEYFTIPHDSYAALVRTVRLTNTTRRSHCLQVADGLPHLVPYGTANLFLKKLSRTIEAWMHVTNLERCVPFYKLDVDPTDRPEVLHIQEGNFYCGFHEEGGRVKLIKPVVDPETIFGAATDFSCPQAFLAHPHFRYPAYQLTTAKTPCGMLLLDAELKAGEEKTFYTIVGYMRSLEGLNAAVTRIAHPSYIAAKRQENRALIEGLQQDIATSSGSSLFDHYTRQSYLDNILRGGYPLSCKTAHHTSTFYLYTRKHGDLERDYNKFSLQPSYFSQGNGNYRDINQNRRCDVWFNPDVGDENIITFMNLIQPDGYNPLVVKGVSYHITDRPAAEEYLRTAVTKGNREKLLRLFDKSYTPGEVLLFLEDNPFTLSVSRDEFLCGLIALSDTIHDAEHGEGYWSDHWSYNTDLIAQYLAVFPEKKKELFFGKRTFTYFDNTEIVRPRHERYVLYKDRTVKQLHSVVADGAKKEMIRKRSLNPHTVRCNHGNGPIYTTTLVNKLLCIIANKLASLDPFGVGIEMEADKPNWYDALNGLPALCGSSTCETFELKRLIRMVQEAFRDTQTDKIAVTREVWDFIVGLGVLLKENLAAGEKGDFVYWDKSASLKEAYRARIRHGFDGIEVNVPWSELDEMLTLGLGKIERGLKKAFEAKQKVYLGYFINEVVRYERVGEHGVKPLAFKQIPLPLFLEPNVHALRLIPAPADALALYEGIRRSPLYDRALKMYKVTAPLASMPEEIGRCRVFTPGWLENESVWLHLEYKYLLELLRCGLYKQFFEEFKNVLVPFQQPKRYGRNILENSSFIVSSAFPDKRLHGAGYVARLSGSTAEFLNMWLLMNAGTAPFQQDSADNLTLTLSPILPASLFRKKEKKYAFTFLSSVAVTYHNPRLRDTFGKNAVRAKRIAFCDKDGKQVTIASATIPSPYAEQVRSRLIRAIDIYLE